MLSWLVAKSSSPSQRLFQKWLQKFEGEIAVFPHKYRSTSCDFARLIATHARNLGGIVARVFISYSRTDIHYVERLTELLREHGQEVATDLERVVCTLNRI